MPEATVNKYNCFVFGEYNVRFSGQPLFVKAVAEPFGEEEFPYQHLGLRILTLNPAHIVTPGCLVVNVCHTAIPLLNVPEPVFAFQ